MAFELDKSSKSNSRSSNKNNNKAEQGLVTVPVQAGYHVQYLFRLPGYRAVATSKRGLWGGTCCRDAIAAIIKHVSP